MTPFKPEPIKTTKLWTGVCRDGPWKGLPLTAGSRFVCAPDGNEYCNDGVGHWNWVELHHEGKK
jgi:hypothetical protein